MPQHAPFNFISIFPIILFYFFIVFVLFKEILLPLLLFKHTPCRCGYLLAAQPPARSDSAAVCPPLSGHNGRRTAPPFDSAERRALKMTHFLETNATNRC